ncbi:hypothetical protein SDC9_14982 [bioreactor metagenome]|uniref:DUF445 domain-containing protein n=1 Tax=bioreactor metagenome TaxID=1076179 RepID=A0A644TQG6_9ZZZZ
MKNRKIANATLTAVALLFGVVLIIRYTYYDSLLLKALYIVLEAALIGGIADWFAVTALFEKPLGFPWHTAIIPRNRTKIINALTKTVENELLSKESIKERLADIHMVRMFVVWVEESNGKKTLAEMSTSYIRKIIFSLDARQVAQTLEQLLRQKWQEVYLSALLGRLVKLFLDKKGDEKLIDLLLNEMIRTVETEKTREMIHRFLERYSHEVADSWWKRLLKNVLEAVDAVNLADAAAVLQTNILNELRSIKEIEHPLRQLIHTRLSNLVYRMDHDPGLAETIKEWQVGLAGRINLEDILTELIELALQWERKSISEASHSQVEEWLFDQVSKYWEVFKNDHDLQDWLEKYVKEAIHEVIESEHHLVGTITSNALGILTDEKLSEFIDDKAGEDLQWIRINGSVVGGFVGLILFLFLHFVYDPYVVPLVRGIF